MSHVCRGLTEPVTNFVEQKEGRAAIMVNIILLILHITASGGLIMNLISPSAAYALIGYLSLLIVSLYNTVRYFNKRRILHGKSGRGRDKE